MFLYLCWKTGSFMQKSQTSATVHFNGSELGNFFTGWKKKKIAYATLWIQCFATNQMTTSTLTPF